MSSQLFRFLATTCLFCPSLLVGITITKQPEATKVPLDLATYLQVEAEEESIVTYQWYRNETKLPDETNSKLVIEAQSNPGEFIYKVEISDGKSTVMSEEAKLVIFDVAEILGAPGYKITAGPSPTDIYTDMLSEEEPGIHLRTFPGTIIQNFPEQIRKAPSITLEIEGSALIEVTHSGGIGRFPTSEQATTNRDSSKTPSYPIFEENHYSNYVVGEGTHSVVIYPQDVFMSYRYGSSATIRQIKVHPLPNNNFIADMRRDEMNLRGSYTTGDIEQLDFDGDGRSNLLEWMQSTNPFENDQAQGPHIPEPGDPYLQYHFRRPQNIYPYSYRLEASIDLVNWEKVDARVSEAGVDGGQHVRIWDTVPFGSAPKRFLRLKVYIPK